MSSHLVRSVFLCTLMAVLAGCSTVREARKIQKSLPEERVLGERTATAPEAGILPGAELKLSELEQIALKCNPAVFQAALSVEQSRLALSNAKAGYLPSLSTSASHNRSTHNNDRHSGTTANTGSYSGGLNMSITVFDFGRTSAAVRAAQDSLAATIKEYDAKCNATIYSVRKAYFELQRAMQLHDVAVEAVSQYYDHLEQVKLKREIGEAIEYDVLKADVDYQNARLEEITTANAISVGWANLNLALGLAETPEYRLGGYAVREYSESAEELLERACAQEPSLAALRYTAAVASGNLDAAIADLYPSLSFSLGGSVSGRTPALPWLWNLSSGLSIGQNLFNGGRTRNAIWQSMYSLQQARSRYEASRQTVYRDLRTAVLNALRARQSQEVAELVAKSAQRNLEIVNEKYKQGKATSVDRTDAQVSFSSAKAKAVNARYDYLESQTAIANLIGE